MTRKKKRTLKSVVVQTLTESSHEEYNIKTYQW